MSNKVDKNQEINYKMMTEKISDWKKDIEKNESLINSLRNLADK